MARAVNFLLHALLYIAVLMFIGLTLKMLLDALMTVQYNPHLEKGLMNGK